MGIKVKHDGNVTAEVMASAEGGRQKRAIETAKLATNQPERIQTLQAAHAGAAPINMAHAQMIHASPGTGIASAPLIGGRGSVGSSGSASSRLSPSGVDSSYGDYKVTGNMATERPDAESVWVPGQNQWVRKYLPGEKEADAYARMTPAMMERQRQMDDQSVQRYTAQQQAEWEQLNDVVNEASRSGRYTPEEMAAIREQVDMQRLRIKENPRELLQKEETAQQAFSRNTFTDDNGMVYTRDGRLVYNPNEERAKETDRQDRMFSNLVATFSKPYVKESQAVDANGNPIYDEDGVPRMIKETVIPTEADAVQRAYNAISYRNNPQQVYQQQLQQQRMELRQGLMSAGLSDLEKKVLGMGQEGEDAEQKVYDAQQSSAHPGGNVDLSMFAANKRPSGSSGASTFSSSTSSEQTVNAPSTVRNDNAPKTGSVSMKFSNGAPDRSESYGRGNVSITMSGARKKRDTATGGANSSAPTVNNTATVDEIFENPKSPFAFKSDKEEDRFQQFEQQVAQDPRMLQMMPTEDIRRKEFRAMEKREAAEVRRKEREEAEFEKFKEDEKKRYESMLWRKFPGINELRFPGDDELRAMFEKKKADDAEAKRRSDENTRKQEELMEYYRKNPGKLQEFIRRARARG